MALDSVKRFQFSRGCLNLRVENYLLQGYMVGNGVCDDYFDGNAIVPFAHGMGLISESMFKVMVH